MQFGRIGWQMGPEGRAVAGGKWEIIG